MTMPATSAPRATVNGTIIQAPTSDNALSSTMSPIPIRTIPTTQVPTVSSVAIVAM